MINKFMEVDFFHDFLEFLRYASEKSLKKTATGNIALSEIAELSKLFRDGHQLIWLDEEMGWKVRTEPDCQYLHQVRVIAEAMGLITKRGKEFRLSKIGKDYLLKASPEIQYEQMVLGFWNRVNWEYFSPGKVTSILQKEQKMIWENLLRAGSDWIDFKPFCQALKITLNLSSFYEGGYNPDHEMFLDIRYAIFERNLKRFGCVEVKMEKGERGKNWDDELVRFRSTDLGLQVYQKMPKLF